MPRDDKDDAILSSSFLKYTTAMQTHLINTQPSLVFGIEQNERLVNPLSTSALLTTPALIARASQSLLDLKIQSATHIKVLTARKQQYMEDLSEKQQAIQKRFAKIHSMIEDGPRVFHYGLHLYGNEPLPGMLAFIQQKGQLSVYQTNSDSYMAPKHLITHPLPFQPLLCIETARLKPSPPLIEYFCTAATKQYIITIEFKMPEIVVTVVREQQSGVTKNAVWAGGDNIVTRNDADTLVYENKEFTNTVGMDVKVCAVMYDEELGCVFGASETHFIQITASQKINYLHAFPEPNVTMAGFSVGSARHIIVMSDTKTYTVMINIINNAVTVSTSNTRIKGIMSWESGFVGYSFGRILFLDSNLTEIWGVKVGDAIQDSLENGQDLIQVGKGATSFYVYWRGNKWCCVSANTQG